MSKVKPITPYERLKRTFRECVSAVECPHTKFMWRYPKKSLHEGWSLTDLAERGSCGEEISPTLLELLLEKGA